MSSAAQITLGVIALFALLALLTFMRLLLRRNPPNWTRISLGVYIEREPEDDLDLHPLRPTTVIRPEQRD